MWTSAANAAYPLFAARAGQEPPRPGWKDNPAYADALPKKDLKP